jgi:hypothetical protein
METRNRIREQFRQTHFINETPDAEIIHRKVSWYGETHKFRKDGAKEIVHHVDARHEKTKSQVPLFDPSQKLSAVSEARHQFKGNPTEKSKCFSASPSQIKFDRYGIENDNSSQQRVVNGAPAGGSSEVSTNIVGFNIVTGQARETIEKESFGKKSLRGNGSMKNSPITFLPWMGSGR